MYAKFKEYNTGTEEGTTEATFDSGEKVVFTLTGPARDFIQDNSLQIPENLQPIDSINLTVMPLTGALETEYSYQTWELRDVYYLKLANKIYSGLLRDPPLFSKLNVCEIGGSSTQFVLPKSGLASIKIGAKKPTGDYETLARELIQGFNTYLQMLETASEDPEDPENKSPVFIYNAIGYSVKDHLLLNGTTEAITNFNDIIKTDKASPLALPLFTGLNKLALKYNRSFVIVSRTKEPKFDGAHSMTVLLKTGANHVIEFSSGQIVHYDSEGNKTYINKRVGSSIFMDILMSLLPSSTTVGGTKRKRKRKKTHKKKRKTKKHKKRKY
jgi:hypothetical protein